MGACCSCLYTACCGRCAEKGFWEGCCCCVSKYMSPGKCLSVVPWAPLLAMSLLTIGGGFAVYGFVLFYESMSIAVNAGLELYSPIAFAAMLALDFVFVYSVCSNKLRIHNVHWMAEGCQGYRIKDATNCCSALLRCFCKMYNFIIACWCATRGASASCTT